MIMVQVMIIILSGSSEAGLGRSRSEDRLSFIISNNKRKSRHAHARARTHARTSEDPQRGTSSFVQKKKVFGGPEEPIDECVRVYDERAHARKKNRNRQSS